MRFVNPIPFVRDINRSKEFYRDRLGLTTVSYTHLTLPTICSV